MKEDNIYKELEHVDDFKVFDVEQEWSAFLAKAKAENTSSLTGEAAESSNQISTGTVRKLPLRIISIAAGIAALIGCFFFLNQDSELNQETQIVEVIPDSPDKQDQHIEEQVITDVQEDDVFTQYSANQDVNMPDGSTIKILAATSLKIPNSFEGLSERYVEFRNGNVEFSIVSNASQPFRVVTDNSGIFVTGTTFRMVKSGVETVVKTISGSVEMYSLEDESIKTVINAGEEFSYNGETITEVVAEATVEEVKMSPFPLENIKDFAKDHFSKNLKFERKAIPKSLKTELLLVPSNAMNTGEISTVDVIMKALEEQFVVESEPMEGCTSCYKIKSISKKE